MIEMEGYKIISLKPSAWRRYKHLRLEALRTDASAFADSYAEGIGKPRSVWMKRLQASDKGEAVKLFFAQSKNELVGMVGIEFDLRDKRLHTAKIRELFVTAEGRGAGVGAALVQTALDFIAKKRKRIKKIALSVNVTQKAAQSLYKKMGFEVIGLAKREIKVHGYYIDQYLMEKYF